jgi:hypothetical protein
MNIVDILIKAIEANPTTALKIIEDLVGILKANPDLLVEIIRMFKK